MSALAAPTLGFFYGTGDATRALTSAERCAQAGATWAAVPTDAVDGRLVPPGRVQACVEALRGAGVAPVVYSFPQAVDVAHVRSRVGRAADIAASCGLRRVIVDAEPYGGQDWSSEELAAAHDEVTRRGLEVAWTIYDRDHWDDVVVPPGDIYLQLYRTISSVSRARARIAEWPGRRVVVCIGTYLEEGRLARDLGSVRALGATEVGIWKLGTTDARERAQLAEAFRAA